MLKEFSLKKIKTYLLFIFITTLFIFAYDIQLVKISNLIFTAFAGITIVDIFQKKEIKLNKFYFIIGMLFFLAVLSTFWAYEKNSAITSHVTFFQLLILMILVYNIIDENSDIVTLLKGIAFGGLGMSFYGFYYYGFNQFILSIRYGDRLGAEINQGNAFGYLSVLTFIVIMYYAIIYKKYSYLLVSIIPLATVLASGSRRSLLLLFIALLLIFIVHNMLNKKKLYTLLLFAGLIIIVPILFYLIENLETFRRFNFILTYFKDESEEVDSSFLLRKDMIAFGFELYKENPILGYGSNQYKAIFNKTYGVYSSSHNGFVNTLVELETLGFVLYYGMFIHLIIKLWNQVKFHRSKISGVILILIVITLIGDIATISFNNKFTYILLALGFACVANSNKNTRYPEI